MPATGAEKIIRIKDFLQLIQGEINRVMPVLFCTQEGIPVH